MPDFPSPDEAEATLAALAGSFLASATKWGVPPSPLPSQNRAGGSGPDYQARYRALVENIPAVIFVAPLESGLGDAYISPQIESILGFTQEEWLGDPLRWYHQVHPADKQRWSVEASRLFLSGQPLLSTYRVLARDGRVVWFQCDARMIHSQDGKPSFIHGIGFDVTELKETEASLEKARDELERRVEERTQALALSNAQLKREIAEHQRTERQLVAAKESAEAAAQVKSEFLANMSHEIRTPMNGVLGMTNLVLRTELSAEQREYLTVANSSAESLLGIINQVLDFSKAESGNVKLHSECFSLRASLKILVKELELPAQQKGLLLTHAISPDLPDTLIGDIGRLRQVLINLLGNAIKFTPAGQVSLEVLLDQSPEKTSDRSCVAHFAVIDTGIGIPASKANAIFEPFTQADGSITREYGGTGLGLTIARQLVTMMGGRLEVASEPGRGSTFSFSAPFRIARDRREEPSLPPEFRPRSRSALRVLIAEDNLINQKVVSEIIEKYGHSVTLARNGHEAFAASAETLFDVALMDIQMPVMDGLSATAAIRAREAQQPGAARLPIIALTAHALKSDFTRCIQAGMDGYLAKPFKATELIQLIEDLTASEPQTIR